MRLKADAEMKGLTVLEHAKAKLGTTAHPSSGSICPWYTSFWSTAEAQVPS